MPTQVTCWQTADGTIYQDHHAACVHEFRTEVVAILEGPTGPGTKVDPAKVVDLMVLNAERFSVLLNSVLASAKKA